MSMLGHRTFKSATRPDTPSFATATAMEGQYDTAEKARINSLRGSNTMGGVAAIDAGAKFFAPEAAATLAAPTAATVAAPTTAAVTGAGAGAGATAGSGMLAGLGSAALTALPPAAIAAALYSLFK